MNIPEINTSGLSYVTSTEINESNKSNISNSVSNTNIPEINTSGSSYITSTTVINK
jgi:hypothetical protein